MATFEYRSGDQAVPRSVAQIPLILGTCATLDGTAEQTYIFDAGDDVEAVTGAGVAPAMVLSHGSIAGRCVFSPVAGTYPSLPSVTKSGSGPSITIAAIGDGANDTANVRLTVSADAARISVSYDGTTEAEAFPIPVEGPAVVRGTVDISSSVPAMNGLTLIFSAPTSATITFASSPTTPAALVAAFDALAVAAPLAVRARIHESTSGAVYFELYSTATGTSAAVTISSSSTGEATLGLSTSAAAGTAATRTFAWLGFTATFPAGPYEASEIYSIDLTGPRGAVADYVSALDVAIANYSTKPFGYVVVAESPATNANAKALYDALRAISAAKRLDPDDTVLFDVLTPSALWTASAVKSTSDTAITAWEADLLSAMGSAAASLESIAAGDCYVSGPPKMPGTFRRPATWAAAFKRSTLDRIAGNACDGGCPGVALKGPGGQLARDEAKRSTKLAGLAGAGFWVLKSGGTQGVKFAPAATRAGSLDRYRSPGAVAFALEASRAILPILQSWEGTWESDEDNPKAISPDLARHREGLLEQIVEPIAFPPNAKRNVAAFNIAITGATTLDDGEVQVVLRFNPSPVAEAIAVSVTATGVSLNPQGA